MGEVGYRVRKKDVGWEKWSIGRGRRCGVGEVGYRVRKKDVGWEK